MIGMMMIVITTCAVTFFFLAPNFGAKAYAQENNINNNDTALILEDMRTIMRDQQRDMSSISNMTSTEVESIKNMTSVQLEVLKDINTTSTKLAVQSAYTALSVFFLGISLVIFGLKLTSKVAPRIGRSMNIMVWALTVPVIILVGLFQYGLITGNSPLAFLRVEEPYSLLSFLMYVPIGIVVFMLLAQHKIMHAQAQGAQAAQAQAAQAAEPKGSNQGKKDVFQELERLGSLKQQGLITEEEFQKLKTRLLSGT